MKTNLSNYPLDCGADNLCPCCVAYQKWKEKFKEELEEELKKQWFIEIHDVLGTIKSKGFKIERY